MIYFNAFLHACAQGWLACRRMQCIGLMSGRTDLWVVTERQHLAEEGDWVLAQLLWVPDVAVHNCLEWLVALPRRNLVLNLLCSDDYLTPVHEMHPQEKVPQCTIEHGRLTHLSL